MTLLTCEAVVAQASDYLAGLPVSPDPQGSTDERAFDLGRIPDGQSALTREVPSDAPLGELCAVVVYCEVFSVVFGYGTLAGRQAPVVPASAGPAPPPDPCRAAPSGAVCGS